MCFKNNKAEVLSPSIKKPRLGCESCISALADKFLAHESRVPDSAEKNHVSMLSLNVHTPDLYYSF